MEEPLYSSDNERSRTEVILRFCFCIFRGYSLIFFKFMNKITDIVKPVIIPGLSEPLCLALGAPCPENESHIFR